MSKVKAIPRSSFRFLSRGPGSHPHIPVHPPNLGWGRGNSPILDLSLLPLATACGPIRCEVFLEGARGRVPGKQLPPDRGKTRDLRHPAGPPVHELPCVCSPCSPEFNTNERARKPVRWIVTHNRRFQSLVRTRSAGKRALFPPAFRRRDVAGPSRGRTTCYTGFEVVSTCMK